MEIVLSGEKYKLTKRKSVRQAYNNYLNSNNKELTDVYGKCSIEKHRAYEECKHFYKKNSIDETSPKIINHCVRNFSCGAVITAEDGSKYFVYDTYKYRYIMKIK